MLTSAVMNSLSKLSTPDRDVILKTMAVGAQGKGGSISGMPLASSENVAPGGLPEGVVTGGQPSGSGQYLVNFCPSNSNREQWI